jgi:spore coat protein U-like protein
MKHRARHLILLTALCAIAAAPAIAQITCSTAAMTDLNFGSIDPSSSATSVNATLTYSCRNTSANKTHSARVCFSIGEPGGRQTNPRQMLSGANTLNFQLYQDSGHSIVWGSSFFGSFLTPYAVTMTLAGNTTTSGSQTMYGFVLGNQITAIPGNYAENYLAGDTALTINDAQSNTAPTTCDTTNVGSFPFGVTAVISKQCTVSATTLDFGAPAGFLTSNVDSTSTVTTQCSNGTPYQIGFNNGAHATGTTRRMSGGSSEFITYELYRDSNRTLRWGGTPNTDTVNGTGNGLAQGNTVYGRVAPQATPSPSSYSDTITINVTY